MRLFTQEYRVYIEDTDMMNIVYHSNYLNFCERARTECLRVCGFSLTNLAKDDTYFALKHLNIDYKAPAILDDILRIETQVEGFSFCQLKFLQSIFNQNHQLLAELQVHVVCVNAKMLPKRLPRDLMKEL